MKYSCHWLLPIEAIMHKEYETPSEFEQDALDKTNYFTPESRLAWQLELKKSVYEGKTLRFAYAEY